MRYRPTSFLLLSPFVLSVPYFFYPYVAGSGGLWGLGAGVGLIALGHYLYLLLQVSYYACGLSRLYLGLGGVVFALSAVSVAAPEYMALSVAGLFFALAAVVRFGVSERVFRGWLSGVVWLFLWNLLGGLIALPARLLVKRDIWLWWAEPPADPLYVLAVGAAGVAATLILGRIEALARYEVLINKCRGRNGRG